MSAVAPLQEAPGLDSFLAEVEDRLEAVVAGEPGLVGLVARDALVGGGKRLRPALCFFAAPPGSRPPLAAAVAVELVHTATLVHDDVIDQAPLRRGRRTVWSAYGRRAASAAGDYLFARAFSELAATGDGAGVGVLARATLSLARGEALQQLQAHDPDTSVDAYLYRCALKTGKLLEAACLLGSGRDPGDLARFGVALGIAFQIADDILDCSGETTETGKVPGTDLREGTPTLPLLLAAREDAVVRAALAGGPPGDTLARVAATGALERSRQVALKYASQARACLNGDAHHEELAALTYAAVDRKR